MKHGEICIGDVEFDDTQGYRRVVWTNKKPNEKYDIRLDLVDSVKVTSPIVDTKAFGPVAMWTVTYGSSNPAACGWIRSLYWCESEARNCGRALEVLATDARKEASETRVRAEELDAARKLERFKEQASAWRESAIKPGMPEEARRHKILAENAFREKDVGKAAAEYEAALNIFPCWPEGQFNLALICGELKYYRTAILHMKCYLELMPDAPNAQAARDKVIIWEDKIKLTGE
jgi:tetratricopeptide (TPR) repeat protein